METCMNLWQQNYDPAGNIWLKSYRIVTDSVFLFCPDKAQAQRVPGRDMDRGHCAVGRAAVL
jgi:hypothetical protein